MASESIASYQSNIPYPQQGDPSTSHMGGGGQHMGEVADMLNNQLASQVDPNSFVDPNTINRMSTPMQPPHVSESKIPEYLKDPLLVFVLVVIFSYPAVRNGISKYVPQIGVAETRTSITNSLVLALFVAVIFGLVKKFVLKN